MHGKWRCKIGSFASTEKRCVPRLGATTPAIPCTYRLIYSVMLYHSTTGDTLWPLFGLWERKHFDTQIWLFHNQSLKWKDGLAISPSPSLTDSISAIDFSVVMDGQCRNERRSWFKLLYRVLRRSLRFLTWFLDINRIYTFCWWMQVFNTKIISFK